MARKGLRKLVDIADDEPRKGEVLRKFLARHSIDFERYAGDGFVRYYVQSKDLCCAQSVLLALEDVYAAPAEGETIQ